MDRAAAEKELSANKAARDAFIAVLDDEIEQIKARLVTASQDETRELQGAARRCLALRKKIDTAGGDQ